MRAIALLLVAWGAPAATFDYWVDPCAKPAAGCHRGDSQLAKWALEAWSEATRHKLIFRETFEREKAQIRVNWASGNQGLYGEARPIVVNGIRGAEVYVLPPAEIPEDPLMRDAVVYLTCLHETGHALGLAHTAAFADIMYSFQYGGDIPEYFGRYRRQLMIREDIHKHSGMSADDRKRILELYR